jgi:hypothetical protein
MNGEQIASLVRTALKLLAGSTVGVALWKWFGLDPSSSAAMDIVGTLALVVGVVWSHVTKTPLPTPPTTPTV